MKSLANESVEWVQDVNEQVWTQMKGAFESCTRDVCGCAKLGGKNVSGR